MVRYFPIYALAIVISAPPVVAQDDDPMAAQRCIWQCQANTNGVDDPAYRQCISQFCEAEVAPSVNETSRPTSDGRWAFNDHAIIGKTAQLITQDGVIGIGCGNSNQSARLMVENTMFEKEYITLMFPDSGAVFSLLKQDGAFTEKNDSTCGISLSSFREDSSVILLNANVEGISADGIQMTDGTRSVLVTTGEEALQTFSGKRLSLTGSSRAIKKVIEACAPMRMDIENDCGI